jgi:hypothetical protein
VSRAKVSTDCCERPERWDILLKPTYASSVSTDAWHETRYEELSVHEALTASGLHGAKEAAE